MSGVFDIDPGQFERFCINQGWTQAAECAAPLRQYLELLLKWNRKINLTACTRWQDAMLELIADSFHLKDFISALHLESTASVNPVEDIAAANADSRHNSFASPCEETMMNLPSAPKTPANAPVCWDLGAGAGLPGIPLRILWQEGRYHMIELREKRALFLQTTLARLKLANTFVQRCDAAGFMQRENAQGRQANLILSRAFMPWQELLPYVRPYLPEGGVLLLMLNGTGFEPDEEGWNLKGGYDYQSPSGPRQFVALSPVCQV